MQSNQIKKVNKKIYKYINNRIINNKYCNTYKTTKNISR